MNNKNNGKTSQSIQDQVALFNQLTLHNILNGRNDLGTPKLKATKAAMTDEQMDKPQYSQNVMLRSWQDYLMGLVSRPLQTYRICQATFQKLSPTREIIQEGSFLNLLTGQHHLYCLSLRTSQIKSRMASSLLKSSK